MPTERDERDRRHLLIPRDDEVQPGDPRNEPTKLGERQDDGLDLWPDTDEPRR